MARAPRSRRKRRTKREIRDEQALDQRVAVACYYAASGAGELENGLAATIRSLHM